MDGLSSSSVEKCMLRQGYESIDLPLELLTGTKEKTPLKQLNDAKSVH